MLRGNVNNRQMGVGHMPVILTQEVEASGQEFKAILDCVANSTPVWTS